MKYIIISPVKNEEKYLLQYVESIISQTLLPSKLVLVDDSSTDRSLEIINTYAKKFDFIKVVQNDKSNDVRAGGPKVVNAFLKGFDIIKNGNYDVICKIDADQIFPLDYFEKVMKEYESNNLIGMCGGYCVIQKNGEWIQEDEIDYHLRGALKSYRKECYQDIGGIKPIIGWDGIDELSAMYKGWHVKILNIPVKHLRPTSSEYNKLRISFNQGISHYKRGHSFLLTLIRFIKRFKNKPYMIYSFYYLTGYLMAYFKKETKYVDKDFAKFINTFHFNRIKLRLK